MKTKPQCSKNLGDPSKLVLRRKFTLIAIEAYLNQEVRKQEQSQVNDLILCLQ